MRNVCFCFLLFALSLAVTSSTGTYAFYSEVDAYANGFEKSWLTNNFQTHCVSHTVFIKFNAAEEYSGWYNGTATLTGFFEDDDSVGEYYTGGTWDIAVGYGEAEGVSFREASGAGQSWGQIHGNKAGSWTDTDDNDSIAVTF